MLKMRMRNAAAAARPVNASGVAAISVWSSDPVETKAATTNAKTSEPAGTATASQRGCLSLRSTVTRMRAAPEGRGAARRPSPLGRLALRAPDHALHEPVHAVEAVRPALQHLHPHALLDAELAGLVVQRALELVPAAVLELLLLLRDRGLRLRRDARPVRRELREAVVDRAVVEAGLPRAVHRRLHAAEVVQAPVVDRGGQPGLGRELRRVRVVADPRDVLRLRVLPGRGRVDVLAEHAGACGDEALRRLLLLRRVEPRVRPHEP